MKTETIEYGKVLGTNVVPMDNRVTKLVENKETGKYRLVVGNQMITDREFENPNEAGNFLGMIGMGPDTIQVVIAMIFAAINLAEKMKEMETDGSV